MQFCGVLPQDKTPGIKLLEDLWKRYKSVDKFETSYWEGVVVAMIKERSAHRASGLYGKINAENINKAMETFKNEDFGGLIPNTTYTKDNHEGSFKGRIVQIHEDIDLFTDDEFLHSWKREGSGFESSRKVRNSGVEGEIDEGISRSTQYLRLHSACGSSG